MELLICISSFLTDEEKYACQIATKEYFICRRFNPKKIISFEGSYQLNSFFTFKAQQYQYQEEKIARYVRKIICEHEIYQNFLTEFETDKSFDNDIKSLPKNLKTLISNRTFANPFYQFPESLIKIVFLRSFTYNTQWILPKKLRYFIGHEKNFQCGVTSWPPKLRYLKIGSFISQKQIDNLPKSLTTLILSKFVDFTIRNLSIKKLVLIVLGSVFNELPESLEVIMIRDALVEFNCLFPVSLKKLVSNRKFTFQGFQGNNLIYLNVKNTEINNIPNSVKTLKLDGYTYNNSNVPNEIKDISLDYFGTTITKPLPINSTSLVLISYEDQRLPNSIKILRINATNSMINTFPDSLERLALDFYHYPLTNLPANLKRLVLLDHFNQNIVLPENLEELRIGRGFRGTIKFGSNLKVLNLNCAVWNYPIPTSLVKLFIPYCLINLLSNNPKIPTILITYEKYIHVNPFKNHHLIKFKKNDSLCIHHYSSEQIKNWKIPFFLDENDEIDWKIIPDYVERIESLIVNPFILY